MKTITRTLKVRELISSEGRIVKATLKWSNNPASAEAGRAWYLVIDGKIQYPLKSEGITSDELAKVWAGIFVRSLGYKFK